MIVSAFVSQATAQSPNFSEGFEGVFPGSWFTGNDTGITTAKWDDNSAKSFTGSWSAFCADNGSDTRTVYDNNLHTYMERRGVSLAGYGLPVLTFKYWLNSESGWDFFTVNLRDQSGNWHELFRTSGNQSSSGWQPKSISLNPYAGQSGLYIQFRFDSDNATVNSSPSGVWVDDVSFTAIQQSIVSAYWLAPNNVSEGAVATMRAQVTGFAAGDQFSFDIFEDDTLSDDYVTSKTGTVYASGGNYYVDATWTTVWQSDGGTDPEFYVIASRGTLSKTSSTADADMLHVTQRETVSQPNIPSGPAGGAPGDSLNYSTGGSTSSKGNAIQYRFNWGDGTFSTWSASTSASKSWTSSGSYSVTAEARSSVDTLITSSPSGVKSVSITVPSATIISPNGGENWTVGSEHTINATVSGSIIGWELDYSTNGGANWTFITGQSTTNTTINYSWTVPDAPTTSGRIRVVVSYANGSVSDASNGNFSILSNMGDVAITLYNADGITQASTQSGTPRIKLYTSPAHEVSGTNPAVFQNVTAGSYLAEGYFTGTFLGEEFWGNDSSMQVGANQSNLRSIARTYPYTTSVVLKNASTDVVLNPGDTVPVGTPLRAEITVLNSTTVAQTSKVRFLLDLNRSSTGFDFDSDFTASLSISGGGTRTYSVPFTPSLTGQFYYALEVSTVVNSASKRTDSYTWTQAMNVSAPIATIADATWSAEVDSDGDGYKSSMHLNWDANVVGSGTLSVFEKIYHKAASSGTWILYATTNSHSITGASSADSQSLAISEASSHNLYDWRIEVYRSGQSTADELRDPSNDSDLNDYQEESASEDVIGPIVMITSPTAGSSWSVGSSVPISWTLSGFTSGVTGMRVSILNNGGVFYTTSLPKTATSLNWMVPSGFVTSTAAIRVEAIGSPSYTAERAIVTTSAAPSTLYAKITAADGTPIPPSLPVNKAISFSAAQSSGPISSYHWRFSDGITSNGPTVTHSFKSSQDGYGYVQLFLNSQESTSAFVFFALTGGGVDDKQGKQGDPVNTATGSNIANLDLMPVAGRGLPFLFQAYYSSQAYRPAGNGLLETPPGSLGYGWTHTFETRAQSGIEDGIRFVLVSFGDGHAEKFILDPATGWNAEPGNYNKLTEADDGHFSLLSRSLLRHDFDLTGRLDAITDQNGNALDVVWEAVPGDANSKRIQKVILPGGPADGSATHEILFHYRPASPTFLWKLEDPMHEHCEFTQDANGDLVSYANELTHSTTYSYDPLHQMLTGTDAKSQRFVRLYYNADRRVYKQEDASGNVTLFSYNFPADGGAGDRITTVTRLADPSYAAADARNEVVEDVHDQKLHLIERRVRVENPNPGDPFIWLAEELGYDPATGDLISKINRRGFETTMQHQNGNLTQVKMPDDGITTFAYTDTRHPTLPTLITYPDTRVKELREYDAKGNLIATTMPYDPAQPTKYRRETIRNAFGQVTETVDANGVHQTFGIDEWGRNTSFTDGETKTHTSEFDANGRKTASIDPRNNRVTLTLNAVGNLTGTSRADPNDPILPITTQVIFDDNEQPIQSTDSLAHSSYSIRDEQGRVAREENHERDPLIHRFDAFGREVETENAKGGITRRTFNFAGYLMSESSPAPSTNVITYKRDANGNATEITDGDGVRTTIEYDSMDRAIVTKRWKSATEFDQTRTSYNLLGQREWDEDAGDALGVKRKVSYHYNLAGDHIRTVSKSGTEFTFDYDFEGHLTSASHTSSLGIATRTQEYNGRYQLKKRTDENGHSEEFFYDDAGNLTRHVQESDSATPLESTFVHDSLNRLVQINPPTGPPITFTYDKASRRIEMSDSTGTTQWTYSTLDQVASIEMPNGLKLSFAYDPLGATETITYPGNRIATYVTDAAGRFQSVTDWASRSISQTYTAGDRPLKLQFPNAVHTDLAHDTLGRLNDLKHQKGTDPALRHLNYGFNALGQLDSIPDVQLTEPESTYTCTYGKANELLTIAGSPVVHDGRGNLKTAKLSHTSPVTDTLIWDYANRLQSGTIGGAAFSNTFSGLGHRTATTRSGVTTGFLHDDRHAMPRIMAETDAAGTPTAFYLYAGDTLLARILPDGSALWYHPDRQGNTSLITDGSGSTAADYQYDPNGVLVSASGSFASSNRFRYLGGLGVWDNDDGTLHARQRTYHPRLGSFLSNDPLFGSIQDGQSLNRYVYALGDPFGFSDPSGFSPVSQSIYWQVTYDIADFGQLFAIHTFSSVVGTYQLAGQFILHPYLTWRAVGEGIYSQLEDIAINGVHYPATIDGRAALASNIALLGVTRIGGAAKSEAALLKQYGGPGGGHHIPAKSAFPGAAGYDANAALAVPNAELARLGVSHSTVTGAQASLYNAFSRSGASLSWDAMASIETQALVRGGMEAGSARVTVDAAIKALQNAGVAGPTRIPWGRR